MEQVSLLVFPAYDENAKIQIIYYILRQDSILKAREVGVGWKDFGMRCEAETSFQNHI